MPAAPSLLRSITILAILNIVGWVAWSARDTIVNGYQAMMGQRPLLAARSWYYHLADINLDKVAGETADLLVLDHAKVGGLEPMTAQDVERLKTTTDGRRRHVVAYMSIGEAETWRFYWNKAWADQPATRPSWLKGENCAWPGAWAVRYWDEGWRKIIYGDDDAFVKRIARAGFDGVYLDRVDMYGVMKAERADAEDLMIDFVQKLAAAGRAINPNFLVIPQNGEELLLYPGYRRVIDALGKEDLLYGQAGTAERNKHEDVAWSLERIRKLQSDRKPTFVVEYLLAEDHMRKTGLELRRMGLVPTFQPRKLDGSDPTKQTELTKNVGTAEYIKRNCDKTNSW
jgi:cysteinyl-tRNA synthetase, unknown class